MSSDMYADRNPRHSYDNVMIGCTVENQDRADFRLPVFLSLPETAAPVFVPEAGSSQIRIEGF